MKKPLARNIDHKTSLISIHIRISIPHTFLDLEGGVRRSGVRTSRCRGSSFATRMEMLLGAGYLQGVIAIPL